jgi:cytochrome c oxidase subunit IV
MVKTFYEILNVLDSKGLALLAFDGIVVAATTFAAEKGDVFHRRGFVRWLAIIIIVLSLTGAALCLFVSEISYPFFHFVECTGFDTLDFSNEISRLATLVEWRTSYYRLAWTCSIVAIPLFLVLFWVSLNWEKQPKPPN